MHWARSPKDKRRLGQVYALLLQLEDRTSDGRAARQDTPSDVLLLRVATRRILDVWTLSVDSKKADHLPRRSSGQGRLCIKAVLVWLNL
jgi:hypothetical protein